MAGEKVADTADSTQWSDTEAAYIRGKTGEAGRLSGDRCEVKESRGSGGSERCTLRVDRQV